MPHYVGGCLCGNVRYVVDAEPLRQILCHCVDCQKHTGTAFMSAIAFATDKVETSGNLSRFTMPGGQSGIPMHRWFCTNCGTPVMVGRDDTGRRLICAGTLDDKTQFQPQFSLFCEQAPSWMVMPSVTENLPRYFT
jgi:hypothetical protein